MAELSGTTYSEIDASNNQAAPNGMPEGMPPSAVNDSWRAAMGAIKRSYDRDHAGSWCAVGGSGNALTLAFAVAPASYVQGEKYAFKAIAANTGALTVNVNGLGAKNVYKKSPTGAAAACTGGEIQNGDIVEIEYDGTQFQLLSNASFAGGTLTAPTAMSGAAFNEAYVSSAATPSSGILDISAIAANFIDLPATGMGSIAGFGNLPAGAERTIRFTGAAPGTLTNSGTLVLPNAASITIGTYDVIKIRSFGSSISQLVSYTRYGGAPIYGSASPATTLIGTDTAQFLTAGGFAGNKSLGANGYYKLPGGLIIQWGAVAIGGSSSATFVFPIAFPNAVFSVVATGAGGALAGVNVVSVASSSTVIFNNSSNPQPAYVIAVGT
jgi:hypothetical protein